MRMNNTISVKNKYTRLFFTCMAVCCGLIWTFTNLGYDGEYQLAMCRRLLQGDKLFLEMWEPHQTSSFLPAFLMWIYISLLGTTTGIVVYLQACGILIRGGISLLLYRTLGRDLTENAAFGIALLFFMISPKDYALPEFSNLQLWFSTLLFCCLWTYLKTGRKYLLAVSALWLSLLVLAYPSCAIVLFGVILLLALYSPYKKRDILLVSGICAILGTAAGGYFLCTVGPENLKACLSGMLALEPTHTEGFFARLSVYGSDLLIQGFLLAAAGVVVLPPPSDCTQEKGLPLLWPGDLASGGLRCTAGRVLFQYLRCPEPLCLQYNPSVRRRTGLPVQKKSEWPGKANLLLRKRNRRTVLPCHFDALRSAAAGLRALRPSAGRSLSDSH